MKASFRTTLKEPSAASAPRGTAARVFPAYRFSGHETFPLRYSWLPKAFAALCSRPKLFADEDLAMVELGVGKNMVRAIRFWVRAAGVAIASEVGSMTPTAF